MKTSEAIQAAASAYASSDVTVFRAIVNACTDAPDTLVPAMAAVLTAAGITPAALGPDMIDQLVAWEKTTSRDDVIATMQAATVALAASEAIAAQTAKPVPP